MQSYHFLGNCLQQSLRLTAGEFECSICLQSIIDGSIRACKHVGWMNSLTFIICLYPQARLTLKAFGKLQLRPRLPNSAGSTLRKPLLCPEAMSPAQARSANLLLPSMMNAICRGIDPACRTRATAFLIARIIINPFTLRHILLIRSLHCMLILHSTSARHGSGLGAVFATRGMKCRG